MDWTAIVVALIGFAGVVVPVALSQRKTRNEVKHLHDEVRTNDGKRAGEYLEMVAKNQDALLVLLAEHTESDARQFAEIKARLDRVPGQLR